MNQDDFRQMLSGKDASQSRYGGKRNLSEADLAEVKKLTLKKKTKQVKKAKNATPADATDAIDNRQPSSQYRDRAAERRSGKIGDAIDGNEYKIFDTEQNKVLGRDMEHTRLVKGLDYALLGQLKREKQKLLAEKKKLGSGIDNGNIRSLTSQDGTIKFKTGMGRLVYYHACQSTLEKSTSIKSELFLPGRMYYTYNLSPLEVESVPVSVQRSKDDCPAADEVVSGFVDEPLINRVTEVIVNKLSGKKKRKKKKEQHCQRDEQQSGNAAAKSAETDFATVETDVLIGEDEDIFPEVGPYIPVDQRTDTALSGQGDHEAIKKAGYFSNLSAAITEKEDAARLIENKAERAWKETLRKAVETQQKVEREKERIEKAVKMSGETDDYAEYQGIGALGEDSDDEDDEKTARRRKAAGLSKNDCDEEEKSRRKHQKRSSKLANDVLKINKIIADKSTK